MTLGFSKFINKKPTHFPQMILVGLDRLGVISQNECNQHLQKLRSNDPIYPYNELAFTCFKYHTIREDSKDRWYSGMNIHFVTGNRTKHRYQFAPVLPVKNTQSIFMTYSDLNGLEISIDDKYFNDHEVLAINDGFESVEDFQNYFIPIIEKSGGAWSGKIIHWTDISYGS